MPEYIEREAAISECLKYNYADKYDKWALKCILKSIPAADVVAVVRCKECKHAKQHQIFPFSRRCKIEDYRLPHRADHFCSYGERRGEDE